MKHLSPRSQTNFMTNVSHDYTFTKASQFMNDKYDCPYCSHTLLRHVCSERIYWRCSHCYQKMPV